MALSINSPEADRLGPELARRRQQPLETVIVDALRAALAREKERGQPSGMADRLMTIGARYARLPDRDTRPDSEILGDNETEASV